MKKPRASAKGRFLAFCTGLPKSGTTSIAEIFGNYRAAHNPGFLEKMESIRRFEEGKATQAEFRAEIVARIRGESLELDGACSNFHHVELLAREFPDAKFIHTVRNCYSWCDSFIDMGLRNSLMRDDEGANIELERFCRLFIGLDFAVFRSKDSVLRGRNRLVDVLLSFWARANGDMIRRLPPARSLILKTPEISQSVEKIARLVGVPGRTLLAARSHSNAGLFRFNVLREISPDFLRRKAARHCDALSDFDPALTADDYLKRPDGRRTAPAVLWFTGLPGSGKSTLAARVAGDLRALGYKAAHLDGDRFRRRPGASPSQRLAQFRKVALTARKLERGGSFVLISLDDSYEGAARVIGPLYRNLIEVFLSTPIAVCEDRSRISPEPFKLTERLGPLTAARAIQLDTSRAAVKECAGRIMGILRNHVGA